MITCCPQCETYFDVSKAQLAAAAGTVRCGQCLHVFSASENAIEEKFLESATSDADEQCFEPREFTKKTTTDNTPPTDEPLKPGKAENATESKWLHDLIFQDLDKSQPSPTMAQESCEDTHSALDKTRIEPSVNNDIDFEQDDNSEDFSNFLANHNPDITFAKKASPSFRKSFFIWFFTCVLLALLLLLQWAWLERNHLSENPRLQPYVAKLCQHIDCSTPAAVDAINIHNYQIDNLNIYPHANKKNVLLVEFTLLNLSTSEKAFPHIALTFTDLNQQIVARRIFKRGDYAQGELINYQTIPPNTPIFIGLEIIEPSTQALNYSMQVVTH